LQLTNNITSNGNDFSAFETQFLGFITQGFKDERERVAEGGGGEVTFPQLAESAYLFTLFLVFGHMIFQSAYLEISLGP
jgi:hypothetical protein